MLVTQFSDDCKEIRCACGKLLFKSTEFLFCDSSSVKKIEIKCPRCKKLSQFNVRYEGTDTM